MAEEKGTTIAKAFIQVMPSASGIKNSLAQAMGDGESEGKNYGSKLGSGIGTALKASAAVIGAAFAAAGTAIVAIGKNDIASYADYEQLVGGVDTLFKDSSSTSCCTFSA